MLEILVSILVLSLGILGAVGMQGASLQANREARLQSAGVRFADEIAELMRSNHQVANKADAADNPYLIDEDGESASSIVLTGLCGMSGKAACSGSTDVAERDIAEWLRRASDVTQGGLPGMRAVICFDSAPYDASGLPKWNCDGTGNTLSIKIGWTRANTLSSATGPDATSTATPNTGAFDRALRPAVVIPVTPGAA